MTAQTTTQRTAKHRQKRAEESARMRAALEVIAAWDIWDVEDAIEMRAQARLALNLAPILSGTP